MPSTTAFEFGDVLLVPFPFTDLAARKDRPAIGVSSDAYQRDHPDLILIALTSQSRARAVVGQAALARWKEAGLLRPSTIKPILFTMERDLVARKLGQLQQEDRSTLRHVLDQILGA